jgi:hypothetical protein
MSRTLFQTAQGQQFGDQFIEFAHVFAQRELAA